MRNYKITNEEDEIKYHDGLNLSNEGISFFKEDIFSGLLRENAMWIREVIIPDDAITYKEYTIYDYEPKRWITDKAILSPKRSITSEIVKELISEGANIFIRNGYALMHFAATGDLNSVKVLVENGALNERYSFLAKNIAGKNGHYEVYKYLISPNKEITDFSVFQHAGVERDCLKIIEICVNDKNIDVNKDHGFTLRWAKKLEHREVVDFLISKGAIEMKDEDVGKFTIE